MSKIIFLTPPAHGHLNPVLPVMRELVQRGEQVICYNTQEFRPPVEWTGAAFRAYTSTDFSSTELVRILQHGNLANATRLILRSTEQLLPFVLTELGREKPDLVVFDSIAMWGKMAANQLGLRAAASISHLVMDEKHMGPLDLLRMLRLVLPKVPGILQARRRLIQRYGKAYPMSRPLFPMRDRLNIVFTTRDLQPDTPIIDESFRFVGPSIDPGTRQEDIPFDALGSLPVVYISLGTVHSAQLDFYLACFEAFTAFPAQFILSVGRSTDLDSLGHIPQNFLVRPSVPQLQVLQHSAVFITHAGINSVQEGLYYGVPLVLLPHQFEQLLNARRVVRHGAGLLLENRLRGKPVPASSLRQALEAVLSEPGYGESARALQGSLRATGGFREAADHIQAYISQTGP